jgi:alpha-beta hydrolase superfamily lysophospholipase
MGDEDRRVYLTYRKLAGSLVDEGFAVVRFSFDGTGDSSGGAADPDRVNAWMASISHAADLVRSIGLDHVAAVGMRFGATLLTHAMQRIDPALDAMVLWDPCVSGREFLRHQQLLLSSISNRPPSDDSGVDTPSYFFPTPVAEEIRALKLRPIEASSMRLLVLARPDRPAPTKLEQALFSTQADRLDAIGQAELLEAAPLSAVVPEQSVREIAGWLAETMPDAQVPVEAAGGGSSSDSAVVGVDLDGGLIREQTVSVGDIGLFGITTVPDNGGSGPWMMFINVANEHHIGPGRVWVDLARHWARHGLRSIRIDLSGVGDSPVHPGQAENTVFAREWLDDFPAFAMAVSPEDPSNVAYVGLCSGGYAAFEAGLAIGARGAFVVNPVLTSPALSKLAPQFDRRRRAVRPLPKPLARLSIKHGRTAYTIWNSVRQVAVWEAPMSVPAAAAKAGMDVFIVAGEDEAKPLRSGYYWQRIGEPRLRKTGRYQFRTIPNLDHSLLYCRSRVTASEVLTEHVVDLFGSTGGSETSRLRLGVDGDQARSIV